MQPDTHVRVNIVHKEEAREEVIKVYQTVQQFKALLQNWFSIAPQNMKLYYCDKVILLILSFVHIHWLIIAYFRIWLKWLAPKKWNGLRKPFTLTTSKTETNSFWTKKCLWVVCTDLEPQVQRHFLQGTITITISNPRVPESHFHSVLGSEAVLIWNPVPEGLRWLGICLAPRAKVRIRLRKALENKVLLRGNYLNVKYTSYALSFMVFSVKFLLMQCEFLIAIKRNMCYISKYHLNIVRWKKNLISILINLCNVMSKLYRKSICHNFSLWYHVHVCVSFIDVNYPFRSDYN